MKQNLWKSIDTLTNWTWSTDKDLVGSESKNDDVEVIDLCSQW